MRITVGKTMKEKRTIIILIGIIIVLSIILGTLIVTKGQKEKEQLNNSIHAINEFYQDMQKIDDEIDECESLKEIKSVMMTSAPIIEKFNQYETDAGNEADLFIDEIRGLQLYEWYETSYMTGEIFPEDPEILHDFIVREYKSIAHRIIADILIERPEICNE